MYHRLTMHIFQPPCDVFELSEVTVHQRWLWSVPGVRTYKLKPICISMCLDELIDVPIYHPF